MVDLHVLNSKFAARLCTPSLSHYLPPQPQKTPTQILKIKMKNKKTCGKIKSIQSADCIYTSNGMPLRNVSLRVYLDVAGSAYALQLSVILSLCRIPINNQTLNFDCAQSAEVRYTVVRAKWKKGGREVRASSMYISWHTTHEQDMHISQQHSVMNAWRKYMMCLVYVPLSSSHKFFVSRLSHSHSIASSARARPIFFIPSSVRLLAPNF